MHGFRSAVRLFSFFVLSFLLGCVYTHEKVKNKQIVEKDTIVVGTLNVAGNEPFAEMRLYDTTGNVYTLQGYTTVLRALWQHQGDSVRCRGRVQSQTKIKLMKIETFEIIK